VALAARHMMPAMYGSRLYAGAGELMTYDASGLLSRTPVPITGLVEAHPLLQWESLGPNAHLSIENERLDRYGYAQQDFANLDRRVRLMQVAHGARENSRHAGTAAPRPATEVNRHRKLLGKFK